MPTAQARRISRAATTSSQSGRCRADGAAPEAVSGAPPMMRSVRRLRERASGSTMTGPAVILCDRFTVTLPRFTSPPFGGHRVCAVMPLESAAIAMAGAGDPVEAQVALDAGHTSSRHGVHIPVTFLTDAGGA